jgi:hypothetical protein
VDAEEERTRKVYFDEQEEYDRQCERDHQAQTNLQHQIEIQELHDRQYLEAQNDSPSDQIIQGRGGGGGEEVEQPLEMSYESFPPPVHRRIRDRDASDDSSSSSESEEKGKYDDDEEDEELDSCSSSESEKAAVAIAAENKGGEKAQVGIRSSQRVRDRLKNIVPDKRLTMASALLNKKDRHWCNSGYNDEGYVSKDVDRRPDEIDTSGFVAFLRGCRNGHITHEMRTNGWWYQKFGNDIYMIKGGMGQSNPIAIANFESMVAWALLGDGAPTRPYINNTKCKDGSLQAGKEKEKCSFCMTSRTCKHLLHCGGKEYPLGHKKCERLARTGLNFFMYLRKCIDDKERGHLHFQGLWEKFELFNDRNALKGGEKKLGEKISKRRKKLVAVHSASDDELDSV